MAKINPKSITLVATFVSPGVAAGAAGFVIVGGKIKKVPPRATRVREAGGRCGRDRRPIRRRQVGVRRRTLVT